MTRRLRLQFERADEFQREFDRNIAKGGVFVPGACDLELREVVEVELDLVFCGRTSRLEAEVVHVVGRDTAPTPAAAGAAVQFLRSAPEVRTELAAALLPPTAAEPAPAVDRVETNEQWQLEDAAGLELDDLSLDDIEDPAGFPLDDAEGAAAPEPSTADSSPFQLAGAGEELGSDLFGAAQDFSEATQEPVPEPELAPAPVVERRRAPRSPARVPASLNGPNARIEGVTRDLSETGALISADASEFPVGKQVRLGLQHPEDGGRFEVGGRVVRHVETEGTVAAVSVLFDVPTDQKDELASLVRAAQSAHEERAASGISGRVEELGMVSLIQMLGRSSPLGTLAVQSGAEEGVLAFDAGYLRYARLGATRGLKALSRMLGWVEGSFEFHAHVAALDDEDEPMRLEAALLELARRADEVARSPTAHFDGAQRFRIDRATLAATEALDKTEEAVLDLAAAGFTVRRIHDVIPESDAQVAAALLALVERGVLEPAE
ncbi:MAG: PilZ domain-containing protein [Myxococcota bacterium]